jgi:hypothetical protein
MLQYRRRNSDMPIPTVTYTRNHPLLTFINWSYVRNRQIDTLTLRSIFSNFNEDYIHIYLRLFNEIPREVINSFLMQENLNKNLLDQIHHRLNNRGFDLRSFS